MSPPGKQMEPETDRLGREAFINLFLAAGRFTDEVEAICKANGLTMSHYTVLWVVCLSSSREGTPMRVIADGILTRAADATRLVDRLAKDGYVERANSDEDRRVVLIRPTRSGRAVFKRITSAVKKLHQAQWEPLTGAELRELRRLLVKTLWGDDSSRNQHPLEVLRPV